MSSEYGDNIVRINIDDDADNKTTRFKVPDTPRPISGATVKKITDYVTFADLGQEFHLVVHSADNPSNVYFRIDSESLQFGPSYLELAAKVNNNKFIYGMGE